MFILSRIAPSQWKVIGNYSKTHFKCLSTLTSSDNLKIDYFEKVPEPAINWDYILNPANTSTIAYNIQNRKGVGDIFKILRLHKEYESSSLNSPELHQELVTEALKLPNSSHPAVQLYGEEPRVVKYINEKQNYDFKILDFQDISKHLHGVRTENLGLITGHRSYYLMGQLAELEQALIHYTVDKLLSKGFELYTVPDLLHPDVIESCGMNTKGERNQVYRLEPSLYGDVCLSGTAEMALASYHMNETLDIADLPEKMVAVSRCYRAETSRIAEERGIYRVHQFTKVEMFGVTTNETGTESESLLNEFVEIQCELFSALGLHFQVLDMPLHELGAPAHRKYDLEAWMPGMGKFGEISSASNCTDYQSRRLGIRYKDRDNHLKFVHTVNGTACAIPRMLIAILETFQQKNKNVGIPEVLRPYMFSSHELTPPKNPLKFQYTKKSFNPLVNN